MNFASISDRMCVIRIRSKLCNIRIVNVHAPIENRITKEKYNFYGTLENVFDKCPKHDVKNIIGDLSAKISKAAVYRK